MTEKKTDSISELFNKKEPLNPELEKYLDTNPILGTGVFHPILYSLFYTEQMNAILNRQFEHKLLGLELARKNKDWSHYVFLHERPHRLTAFSDISTNVSDSQYWSILGDIYTDSENIWQMYPLWVSLLSSLRKEKEFFMSEDDRAFLSSLPEKIKIYRGCVDGLNDNGLSYSLSKETAQWFASRFSKEGTVKSKTISKRNIFAYKSCRNEQEIIIIPKNKY